MNIKPLYNISNTLNVLTLYKLKIIIFSTCTYIDSIDY